MSFLTRAPVAPCGASTAVKPCFGHCFVVALGNQHTYPRGIGLSRSEKVNNNKPDAASVLNLIN